MIKRVIRKTLCVLLTAALLLAAFAPSVFAESFFETNTDEWHYRYYYSGYIELCYHKYGTAENVVIPDKIGAVPVTGFCEGSPYFYTVMLADEKIKTISFDLQLTELPESFAAN